MLTRLIDLGMMLITKGIKMKNGTSGFSYYILQDAVELNVIIDWDEYGEPEIIEISIDGLDVTEDAIELNLSDKLIEYAGENDQYFTSDKENRAEFLCECERNGE